MSTANAGENARYSAISRCDLHFLGKWAIFCSVLLLARFTMGQQRIGAVNLGSGPQAIGVDETNNTIYVVNYFGNQCCQSNGTVTVINGDTLATHSIQVGTEPISMAVDPDNHHLFVIDSAPNVVPAGDITFVDPTTNPPSIATTYDYNAWGPLFVAVDPKTNLVWVANEGSYYNNSFNGNDTNLSVWNASGFGASAWRASVGASYTLGMPQAMVIDTSRGWVYLSGAISGLAPYQSGITAIREASAVGVQRHVNFPQGSVFHPGELAVDEAQNKVYVASFNAVGCCTVYDAAIIVFDGTPSSSIFTGTTIDLGFTGNIQQPGSGMALGLNPVTHHLFVGTPSTVMVVDGSNPPNYPVSTVSNFPAGMSINSIVVNALTNKIYATGLINNGTSETPTMVTIDGSSNTVVSSMTLNTNPYDTGDLVTMNQITNRIYSTGATQSGGANLVLDVVDAAAHTINSTFDSNSQGPNAIAVNSATHKVYVGNTGFDPVEAQLPSSVSVFDPLVGTLQTIFDPTATTPAAVATDPIRNKTYVANSGSSNVTVINDSPSGSQDAYATTISLPGATGPSAIAVDPIDGKVYTANNSSNNVSVIDGASNQVVATVSVDAGPIALAVDAFNSRCTPGAPVLRRVFVVNNQAGTVAALDPDNNYSVVGITSVGSSPTSITVSPCPANQVWVANSGSNDVSMFDAENLGAATTVRDGSAIQPVAIAFNADTGKVYVANESSNNVTIIDSTKFGFPYKTVPVGVQPLNVAVDPNTNHVYVVNFGDSDISIISGDSNSVTTIRDGYAGNPISVVVDPALGNAYAANSDQSGMMGNFNDEITEISEESLQTIPLQSNITALNNNITTSLTPTFEWTTSSTFTPHAPAVNNVFYRIDDVGPWMQATNNGGGSFSSTVTLQPGQHTMYSFAADGQESSSSNQLQGQNFQPNFGFNLSPFTGGISSYTFVAGASSSATASVTVGAQPAGISFSVDGTLYTSSQAFSWLSGSSHTISTTTPQTVSGSPYSFSSWSDNGAISHQIIASPAATYTATFNPAAVSITVNAQPQGLSFSVDGALYTGSQTFSWLSGSSHTISTTTPQTVSGSPYTFSNWSDNGAISHQIVASSAATYTATFNPACAANVSGSITVTRSGFSYNFTTQRFYQTDTLTNSGNSTIAGPISLVLDNLSINASLYNAAGRTTCAAPSGSPFVNIAGPLAPGARSAVVLQFVDPPKTGITYNTRMLAGSGTR